MGAPIVFLCIARALLVVAIKRPEAQPRSGDLLSPYSTRSFAEQTLYSSFDRYHGGSGDIDSTFSQRLAARLRKCLGWASEDTEPGGWINADEAQSSMVKRADLPYLTVRVYLSGDNSPWRPWKLPSGTVTTKRLLVSFVPNPSNSRLTWYYGNLQIRLRCQTKVILA